MTSVRLQHAYDTACESSSVEVVQKPCDSGDICLELWEKGHKTQELYLDPDMLEVFINLEACYRQQGINNSAVHAFRQLSDTGQSPR